MDSASETLTPAAAPSQHPAAIRTPVIRKQSTRIMLILAVATFVLVPLFGWLLAGRTARERPLTHQVRKEQLQRIITARGEMEAAETSDIFCRVRSRTPGRSTSTSIRTIIPDGSRVERGQLLVEFDDSALQEELQVSQGPLELTKADWVLSEKNLEIIRSQNETDLKTAEVTLQLAELDLEKYVNGDYEQSRKDVLGRLTQAETNVRMWLDRASWTSRMTRRGYATPAQNQAEQSRLQSAAVAQDRVTEELRVLEQFTYVRTKKDLEGKVAEARRALERLKIQSRAKETQADADRRSKESIHALQADKCNDLEEQISRCRVLAPHDGIVVYHKSKQSKSGSGSQMAVIAQGEPVFEGQKLMSIPDLSRPVVRVRVFEAAIGRVFGEEYEPTGFSDALLAAYTFGADAAAWLLCQAAWPELRPHFLDRDQRLVYGGQSALVQIDALGSRTLRGHVKSVSNVPAQFESRSYDLRYFDALIAIDETYIAARQDLSAEVTIFADEAPEPVLAVPLQAVVHAPGTGAAGTCYVLTADGPEPREVQLGSSNEQLVEVRDGLTEGEEVVLDPGSLRMRH